MFESTRVAPGAPAGLSSRDPADRLGLAGKPEAAELHRDLLARLQTLQNRLWAEQRRSLLLVLQGMDASGKDGTIRTVLSGVNPQGCRVTSFKAPVGRDAAHDFLWRVHEVCPAHGEMGIFNRSHYEDVIAVRVRALAPESVWRPRLRHIREFERMLTDEGTTIVKVFLHISTDEQRRRLQRRIDDPERSWKFRKADLDDRAMWDQYDHAYEDTLTETSTKWAPWHVVPGDRKWVRTVAVSELVVHALERMDPKLPEPEPGIEGIVVQVIEPRSASRFVTGLETTALQLRRSACAQMPHRRARRPRRRLAAAAATAHWALSRRRDCRPRARAERGEGRLVDRFRARCAVDRDQQATVREPPDQRSRLLVVQREPASDRLFGVVLAPHRPAVAARARHRDDLARRRGRRAAHRADAAAEDAGEHHVGRHFDLDRGLERLVTQDRGEPVGLLDGAGEPVHEEPAAGDLGMPDAVLDHLQHHVVGHELPVVDERLHLEAQRACLGHLPPQDLAGRDVVDAQVGGDAMAHRALARALSAEDHQLGETAHSGPPGA